MNVIIIVIKYLYSANVVTDKKRGFDSFAELVMPVEVTPECRHREKTDPSFLEIFNL